MTATGDTTTRHDDSGGRHDDGNGLDGNRRHDSAGRGDG